MRRAISVVCGAVVAGAVVLAWGQSTQPAERDAFARLVPDAGKVEKVAGGLKFLEGPSWWEARGGLVFSDIPGDVQWLYKPGERPVELIKPSHNANGTTIDREGNLIICRHSARDIVRMSPSGEVTVLAERFEGKRLNSPNDAAVAPDGSVYFTDPPWGVKEKERELKECNVYRVDREGKVTAIVRDLKAPNGIAFSPDGKTLYVSESWWQIKPQFINAYEVKPDGTVGEGRRFYTVDKGTPDGMRVDTDGNVWTTAGDGVHVVAPDGTLLGRIPVPESPANLEFAPDGKSLYITARTSLYAIPINAKKLKPQMNTDGHR
jgi:gluconolactonase